MKKVFVFSLAMFIATASFAQMKGEMSVGGKLGVTARSLTGSVTMKVGSNTETGKNNPSSAVNFIIAPEFNYFVIDNLQITGRLAYGISSNAMKDIESDSRATVNTHSFMIGPAVSYYLKLADKLYYTPEVGIYASVYVEESILKTSGDKNVSKSPAFGGADLQFNLASFEYRPTDRLGINLNLLTMDVNMLTVSENNTMMGTEVKTTTNLTDFNFNLGAGVTVGVKYYF